MVDGLELSSLGVGSVGRTGMQAAREVQNRQQLPLTLRDTLLHTGLALTQRQDWMYNCRQMQHSPAWF